MKKKTNKKQHKQIKTKTKQPKFKKKNNKNEEREREERGRGKEREKRGGMFIKRGEEKKLGGGVGGYKDNRRRG